LRMLVVYFEIFTNADTPMFFSTPHII